MHLTAPRRRCLELLAQAEGGSCPEPALRGGFGIDEPVTAALIEDGLVAANRVRQRVGNRVLEILRLQITAAGRKALGR